MIVDHNVQPRIIGVHFFAADGEGAAGGAAGQGGVSAVRQGQGLGQGGSAPLLKGDGAALQHGDVVAAVTEAGVQPQAGEGVSVGLREGTVAVLVVDRQQDGVAPLLAGQEEVGQVLFQVQVAVLHPVQVHRQLHLQRLCCLCATDIRYVAMVSQVVAQVGGDLLGAGQVQMGGRAIEVVHRVVVPDGLLELGEVEIQEGQVVLLSQQLGGVVLLQRPVRAGRLKQDQVDVPLLA